MSDRNLGTRMLDSLRRFGPATTRQLADRLGVKYGAAANAIWMLSVRGQVDGNGRRPNTWSIAVGGRGT